MFCAISAEIDLIHRTQICTGCIQYEDVHSQPEKHHHSHQLIFFLGHVLPIVLQMLVQNVPPDDPGFRTGPRAIFIYVMLVLSTMANLFKLRLEFVAVWNAVDSLESLFGHFDYQNIVDMTGILYTLGYIGCRFTLPM